MEFHGFENIIETLLVGAVVSVCLMSIVFIFFGQVLQVKVIRSLLAFLVYEKGAREKHEEAVKSDESARQKDVDKSAEDHSLRAPRAASLSSRPLRAHRHGEEEISELGISKHAASKTQETFLIVLVVSSLYGLGIIMESVSDKALGGEDMSVKVEAFRSVSQAQLASGTARPGFSRFFTDYRACAGRFQDLEPERPKLNGFFQALFFWWPAPSHPKPGLDTHELCTGIQNHARGFYYNAKNLVFREETFNHELTVLQSRINFVRSATLAFLLFTYELALACVIAFVAEGLGNSERALGFLNARFEKLSARKREALAWAPPLANHWKDFDAIRCSWFLVAALGLSWFAHEAWRESEKQFDKRVFGYFLTMGEQEVAEVSPQSTYRLFAIGALRSFEPSGIRPLGETSSLLVVNDKGKGIHRFVVFDRGAPALESRTEEHREAREDEGQRGASRASSAVAKTEPDASPPVATSESNRGGSGTVAGSDGDAGKARAKTADSRTKPEEDLNDLSARASLGRWDILRHPRELDADEGTKKALSELGKIEAFAVATPDHRNDSSELVDVYAITNFAAEEPRQLLHFQVDPEKLSAQNSEWLFSDKGPNVGDSRKPPDLCAAMAKALSVPTEEANCTIEGLVAYDPREFAWKVPANVSAAATAVEPACTPAAPNVGKAESADLHFLAGVRSFNKKPVVGLVALDRVGGCWQARALYADATNNACEGISDLEIAESSKALYVITSYELPERELRAASPTRADSDDPCWKPVKASAVDGVVAETDQVHGELWRIAGAQDDPRVDLDQKWELVEQFIHKPEGVGRTAEGSLLVVFDDDARRKSLDYAPATFPLDQNESVFAHLAPRARHDLVGDSGKPVKR